MNKTITEQISELGAAVQRLHDEFGFSNPGLPLEDTLRNRLALLVEEVGEFAKALNHGDIEAACEEVVDMAYVVLGYLVTIESCNPDLEHIARVIAKNDGKRSATHQVIGDKPVAKN